MCMGQDNILDKKKVIITIAEPYSYYTHTLDIEKITYQEDIKEYETIYKN